MKHQILIVDDEPQMLAGMKAILERAGYGVSTAGSGIEAVARLKERQVQVELVVTDLKMPRFNGLDLIRHIRQNHPLCRVVLITAYGTVESAVQAMKLGAFDYLLKPFNAELLLGVVERALSGCRGGSGEREIVTTEPSMMRLLQVAAQAARTDATILVEAESGTGKELLARYIHRSSARTDGPFVAVNCAALPDNLLESELMGHEKGAFTGAETEKPGKFELANGGTILLDEIGEMAPLLQAKILRVLQEKEVDRIGGTRPIPVNVRVIATTNKNLAQMVEEGKFRQDLYFRLNVIPLRIPPLRERPGDLPALVEHFVARYASGSVGESLPKVRPEDMRRLASYRWPGNVRELENLVHRSVVLSVGGELDLAGFLGPEPVTAHESVARAVPVAAGQSIWDMEKNLINTTLESTGGNRTEAARMLQISVRTLRNKLKQMELQSAG